MNTHNETQPKTRIRHLRKKRGLTLQQLGAAVKTTPQTMQRLEAGTMTVSVRWLHKIASVLDVPVTSLLVNSQRPQTLEDEIVEMIRDQLIRSRATPIAVERAPLALMAASGTLAEMLADALGGVRPWRDVMQAATMAAACAIRMASTDVPASQPVPAPLALVSGQKVAS